jgi:hypothetical protein
MPHSPEGIIRTVQEEHSQAGLGGEIVGMTTRGHERWSKMRACMWPITMHAHASSASVAGAATKDGAKTKLSKDAAPLMELQAASKLAARKAGRTTFGGSAKKKVVEEKLEFYTFETLRQRKSVRRHPFVLERLKTLWSLTTKEDDGKISADTFATFCQSVSKVMVRVEVVFRHLQRGRRSCMWRNRYQKTDPGVFVESTPPSGPPSHPSPVPPLLFSATRYPRPWTWSASRRRL